MDNSLDFRFVIDYCVKDVETFAESPKLYLGICNAVTSPVEPATTLIIDLLSGQGGFEEFTTHTSDVAD